MSRLAISLMLPSLLLQLSAAPIKGATVAAETACRGGSCTGAAADDEATLMQLKAKPVHDSPAEAGGDFTYESFQLGDWPSLTIAGKVNMCDGSVPGGFQSPINIQVKDASYQRSEIPGPEFYAKDGGCSKALFVNKSTAWQVDLNNPRNTEFDVSCTNLEMKWNDKVYSMIQFHFHTLSEDTVDFQPFAMEMHMVHLASDNSIAVVGVLIDVDGPWFHQNSFLNQIFEAGFDSTHMVSGPTALNPYSALLKKHGEFWHYPGSLTTPPCSQGLDFFIAKKPVSIAGAHVTDFMNHLKAHGGNSYGQNHRPIQPLAGREITEGRWSEVCPLTGKIPEVGDLDPEYCHFIEEYA